MLATEGDMIEPLKAELELQASRQVIRKENEAKGKTLTIMGDKDIPYRLLRKIMYTSARATKLPRPPVVLAEITPVLIPHTLGESKW